MKRLESLRNFQVLLEGGWVLQLAELGAKPIKMVSKGDRVFWAWRHQLRLGILPARLAASA